MHPPGATMHAPLWSNHACPPEQPRLPPQSNHACPPGATMHAPPRSNHTQEQPPQATTHAPRE